MIPHKKRWRSDAALHPIRNDTADRMLTAENTIHFGRYTTETLTNKMGTPGHMTNEWRRPLGRGILKILRGKQNDQWADIKQIIADPEIPAFFGDIARKEIDDATGHIGRKNTHDTIRLATKLNDATSVEHTRQTSLKTVKGRNLTPEDSQITTKRQTKTLKSGPWKPAKKERKYHRKTLYKCKVYRAAGKQPQETQT